METFGNESSTKKKKHKKQLRLQTGRQIAWMICEQFHISYIDGPVLDISDLLKIDFRGDSVQTFDTKRDETTIVMQKQSDEELIENVYFRQLKGSDQLKQLVDLVKT